MKTVIFLILTCLCLNLFSAEKPNTNTPECRDYFPDSTITDNPVKQYVEYFAQSEKLMLVMVDLNKDGINDVLVSDEEAISGKELRWDVYISIDNGKYEWIGNDVGMNEGAFFFYEVHPDYKLITLGGIGSTVSFFGFEVKKSNKEWKLTHMKLSEITFVNDTTGSDFLFDYLTKDKEVFARHFIKGNENQLNDFLKKDRAAQADKIAFAEKKLQEEKLKAPKIEKKAPEKAPENAKPETEQKKAAEQTGTQGK